jgi:hypothetical protein
VHKNLPHIDEIFRDGIDPYEEDPSPGIWLRLQAQLDMEEATVYKRKYFAVRRAAVCVAALLLFFLVIHEARVIRSGVTQPIGQIRSKNDKANEPVRANAKGSVVNPEVDWRRRQPTTANAISAWKESKIVQPSIPYAKLLWPDSLHRRMAGMAGTTRIAGTASAVRQKSKEQAPFKPYWSVTAFASQEWASYRLENDGNAGQDESAEIAQKERHEPSFTAGAIIAYQFKRKWGIQAGLLYSATSIAIDPQKIYAVKEPDGTIAYKYNSSSGYAYVKPAFGSPASVGDSLSATSAQHNLQYIGIPVTLQYKITKGRFSVSPGLGISLNILTSARIKTEVEDARSRETVTIDKLQGTKAFYVGLLANANMQYDLSPKWSFTIRPGFSYALTSITKNNVVKTYPYSFGAGAGLTYKF